MVSMPISTVQVVPLVISVQVGLIFFVVVMFFSLRSRNRIRSESQRERGPSHTGRSVHQKRGLADGW
jgi:hypothetical protein